MTSRLEIETLKGYTSYVTSVAFSSDGKTLASGSRDQTVKMYIGATEAEVALQRSVAKNEEKR